MEGSRKVQTKIKTCKVKISEKDIFCLLLEKQHNNYANNITHCFLSSAMKREKVFEDGWQFLIYTDKMNLIKKNERSVIYLQSNPFLFSDGIKEELLKFDEERYAEIKPFNMMVNWLRDGELEPVNIPFLTRGSGYICKEFE